jgi:hypothetical protein
MIIFTAQALRMHRLDEATRRSHTETSIERLQALRLPAADVIVEILTRHLQAGYLPWSITQSDVYAALPQGDSRLPIEEALLPFYTAATGMSGGGHR